MKKIIGVTSLLFFSFSLFAQNLEANYNLPPGYSIPPKRVIYNLSYKLDGTVPILEYSASDLQFLKPIPDNELLEVAGTAYYEYIQQGKVFIASLSENMKHIYTNDELWYIYAFDQGLKNRLLNIH